ncbi:MAG: GlxA family transcriptional regulator [Burkholderiales bacterium]|nr:GlxA family transcriptional regulator [Burkholderiales bacterium]
MKVFPGTRARKSRESAQPVSAPPKLRVGFVLAHRFTLTAFAGFVDALRLAADEGDRSRPLQCQWSVLGSPSSPVAASCGAAVQPWDEMEDPARFDYIVVVGGLLHGGQTVPAGTQAFLRAAAHANVTLVGVCTGSFVLARTGLLDGHVACVSWFHREDFEREFPRIRVVSDRMFVVDGDRISCAGGTSVVHLAAHLIDRHCGRAHAAKSLRILIEDQPLGADAPQPESIVTRQATDPVVRRAMLLIEQRLSNPDLLADISREIGVSTRQLERRFLADVAIAPRQYRLKLRLARARWMIEHTDARLTDIGLECGFGSCSHFSRAFSSHFHARPSSLRRRIRAS